MNGETLSPRTVLDEIQTLQQDLATERAQVEAERFRYRKFFDLNPDAHLVTTRAGVIAEANLAASALLGVPRQYLVGKPLAVYVPIDDRPMLRELIQNMGFTDEAELTVRLAPRGQNLRLVYIRAAAMRDDAAGPLQSIRWIIRDVTDARAAEEEIASSREKLRELTSELSLAEERVRREIAVGIHDRVSQPLALAKMLVGKLKLIKGGDCSREAEELNLLLQQAIDESRTLTFELSPPVLYELGLSAAVEWLGEQMQRRYKTKIGVVSTVGTGDIRIDLRVLLFQSIRELLTNVIKHAEAKSAVVALRSSDGMLCVTVHDNGSGFQNSDLLLRPSQPQGFGLFSIRTRVEQVGGHFTIDSEPGHGTRVIIVVPIHAGEPDAAANEAKNSPL